MEIVRRVRPATGEPAGLLVLFHGRGSDEHDLVGVLDLLDPDRRLLGVTPGGPHWYAVQRIGFPDPATFLPTVAALGDWLAALAVETGIPIGRTVLGGFSQGAVMTFALGLAAGGRPAALVPLSGFILTVPGFELDLGSAPPVALGHGTYDDVIPVAFAHDARARLDAEGATVLYRESPYLHAIDPAFLRDEVAPWLAGLLP